MIGVAWRSFEEWIFQRISRQRSSDSSKAESQIDCHDTHRSEERYNNEPVAQHPVASDGPGLLRLQLLRLKRQ